MKTSVTKYGQRNWSQTTGVTLIFVIDGSIARLGCDQKEEKGDQKGARLWITENQLSALIALYRITEEKTIHQWDIAN